MSIKGISIELFILPPKWADMAMYPESVDGLRKVTINRHLSNTRGVAT